MLIKLSEIFKIQKVEAKRSEKVDGYLDIHERPAYDHKIPITILNGVEDGPTLLINGGEHGSEYNGPAACLKLINEINPGDIKGRIIFVPVVNTLGFEFRSMHDNPIDHRDLGGCYVEKIPKGGSGWPKHSYQVAVTFYKECISKADYRLNLHGGDIEEDVLTGVMYSRIGDEERDNLNLRMCRNFGWDWIREGKSSPPKRFMPLTVGTEAGGMGRCTMDMVDMVVKGCENILKYLEMLDGKPDLPKKAKVFKPYHMYSSRGGFFISYVTGGDMVSKGDMLGEIRNLRGSIIEEITAPTDGVVHMVTSPAIWEGDVTYEIGTNIREIE
jgi:predicted deacylase